MKQRLFDGLAQLGVCGLSQEIINNEILFLEELLRWNKKINLTAISDMKTAVDKHLIDSLAVLPYINQKEVVIDIGSGGGLPVIPLAIAMPDVVFISVESVGKKIHFQKHAKRLLGLTNLTLVQSRIEDAAGSRELLERGHVVIARALAPIIELVKLADPLLRPGGRLIAMKGVEALSELSDAGTCLERLYEDDTEIHNYCLPGNSSHRSLVVLKKKRVTAE